MFENFKKIKIKGGFFDTDTEFQVFYEAPIGLVYGRNGSGKTTIAKCFSLESGGQELLYTLSAQYIPSKIVIHA